MGPQFSTMSYDIRVPLPIFLCVHNEIGGDTSVRNERARMFRKINGVHGDLRKCDAMSKSTLIATCLVNSSMIAGLPEGERALRVVFAETFPDDDFDVWNERVDATTATTIIGAVGRAMRIHVDRFIADLWQAPRVTP